MSWRRFPKRSGQEAKYGNKGGQCSRGHSHRSALEISVCELLLLRERAGELKLLQCEDHVYLTLARIGYVPDFKVQDCKTGEVFWVEAKGFANDRWPMKKKLWRYYGPGRLEIWMGTASRPVLTETIVPKGEK